ncbi:muscle M-line assembly protein unc-89-like [Silurus meridionalis]|uniref:muscle M-line assembly protein unc-89-like n=1 Tax=Silurus meridionalis TaxID=175797 RepID=UPI001EEA2283|nr:muscle M-line assembly protein unc-89-like [Silurus meridionalis]
MSIENVFEKNLESECLETEEQFLAKRIRQWQEGVQSDEIVADTAERSEAKGSILHKCEDKVLSKPQVVTQKFLTSNLTSHKNENVTECEAQQKAGAYRKTEVLLSEDVPLAQQIAWQQGYEEVEWSKENTHLHQPGDKEDSSFTSPSISLATEQTPDEHHRSSELVSDSSITNVRSSVKETLKLEQVSQCEKHLSPAKMSEMKSGSVLLADERETLTQEVMKWQQDQAKGPTQEWSIDGESCVPKAEYGIHRTEPSTLTDRVPSFLEPSAKEKALSEHERHTEPFLVQDQLTFKSQSDLMASEEEPIVQPVQRKWNQSHADTERALHFHRSEGEKYKKGPSVDPQREPSFTKVSRSSQEKPTYEHGPRRESNLSRERINELKCKSERYESEEEALTQRIMKWQHDVLSEQDHVIAVEPDWVSLVGNAEDTTAKNDVESSKISQSLPPRTKEMFYTDDSTEDYGQGKSKMQMQFQSVSHQDSKKLQTESDYLVSEEEALATRIKKWQQDILTEQEESVELDPDWTPTVSLTQKTDEGLEPTIVHVRDPAYNGMSSKVLFEGDQTTTNTTYPKDLPQDNNEQLTKSQINQKIKGYQGAAKDTEVCSKTEQQMLLLKQEPMTVQDKPIKLGAPVFLTTLLPNIKVRRGEMTDLQCQFHGDPKPAVCWCKDGQAIISDPDFDVRTREKSSTLTIYYPTKDHQGTFTCNLSNKHGKASISCMLEVTDDEHKVWSETPQEVQVTKELVLAEEQTINEELESLMKVRSDREFSLQVPQQVIYVPCSSDSYRHSSPVEIRITAPTPVLDTTEDIFEPITKTTEPPPDEGTSQSLKHKFTFSFDDLGEAPHIFKQLEDNSCDEGQSVMLECIISGEPAPTVTWLHDDLTLDLSTGRYDFEEHDKMYKLHIHNFLYSDTGTYTCTATNRFGQVQSVASVFLNSTKWGNTGALPSSEILEQPSSTGFSSTITPAVRPKTLVGTSVAFKELSTKGQEGAFQVYRPVPTKESTGSPISHFIAVSDASTIQQKGADKNKPAAQSGGPFITGCGLLSSRAEVNVSKLKQAFETAESFTGQSDDITVDSQVKSYYPVEEIPEFQIQPHKEELSSSNNTGYMITSLITCKNSPLESTSLETETFITKSIGPPIDDTPLDGKPDTGDLHHFVPLAHVTEVQQSPTLIRPQAILPEQIRNIKDSFSCPEIKSNQVENVIKKGKVGAFARPGGSHLEMDSSAFSTQHVPLIIKPNEVELSAQSGTEPISESEKYYKPSNIESSQSGTQEDAGTQRNVPEIAKSVMVKQKCERAKKEPVCEMAAESLQWQQQKAVKPGAFGIRLEEEEVTFSAVYDFYNPPSDWGRPLSPESEMSIEVGSTFSEEIAEIERFYTPASSTEISQFPKSPESFHTSTETPSGATTPPGYPFSPVEHKRPPSISSNRLYSPAKFLRSPVDEGIETTPPVFTIDETMILPEGRDLLGLGSLQEKVQGIPPAFLKPLTRKRVFEGDTLRFSAEVFGLPSPEVKWFRNKTRLVPDDRTTIERDGDNISLEIHNIAKTDQGEYICEAVNYVGEAKSVALVVVRSQETKIMLAPPAVTHQHVIEFDVEEDEDPSRSPSPQEILLEVELDENEVKEFEKQVKIVTIPEYTSDNKSMIISLDVLPSTYDEGAFDFIAQENDDYKIAFEVTEMPPRFINPICDIETPDNTAVMFECSLMGIPSPIVTWFKGNTKISHDKKKYIYSSDGDNHFLKILKVNPQDSGIYTCRAINVVGETLCRASLKVLNPQVFSGKARGRELTAVSLGSAIVQPQKFDLVVGNSSFDGDQPSEIELEFEFPQEADESQKAVRLVAMTDNEVSEQGEHYVSINFDVFAEPSKEDKIEFKGKSTTMCSFHFQVTETPPKCIIPLQNITAAVGTPVMFQCLVSGKPNPTAEWYKDGAPVTNPRYLIQEKASGHFNLLITNAVQSDAGEFKCIILNIAGSTETMASLKVI